MTLVAHVGHWLWDLVFFGGPVAVVGLLLLIQKLRGVDLEARGAEVLGYHDQDDFSEIGPVRSEEVGDERG